MSVVAYLDVWAGHATNCGPSPPEASSSEAMKVLESLRLSLSPLSREGRSVQIAQSIGVSRQRRLPICRSPTAFEDSATPAVWLYVSLTPTATGIFPVDISVGAGVSIVIASNDGAVRSSISDPADLRMFDIRRSCRLPLLRVPSGSLDRREHRSNAPTVHRDCDSERSLHNPVHGL